MYQYNLKFGRIDTFLLFLIYMIILKLYKQIIYIFMD